MFKVSNDAFWVDYSIISSSGDSDPYSDCYTESFLLAYSYDGIFFELLKDINNVTIQFLANDHTNQTKRIFIPYENLFTLTNIEAVQIIPNAYPGLEGCLAIELIGCYEPICPECPAPTTCEGLDSDFIPSYILDGQK